MSVINVQTYDQVLMITNTPVISSGGVNEDYIQFTFDSSWNWFTKTCVFYLNEEKVFSSLVDEDDKCLIPHEVIANSGKFFFGVYGVNGLTIKTSEVLFYSVKQGVSVSVPEPTPDIYAQILLAYNDAIRAIDAEATARENADAAEAAARETGLALKANLTDLTSPFNMKGACTYALLPLNAAINDTWYVTDRKYRMTWNGTIWFQSSLSEVEYTDELGGIAIKLDDIAKGYDETVYSSPGEAVRMQISDIHDEIDNIEDGIIEVIEHGVVTTDFDSTANGITARRIDDYSIAVFGTATAGRRLIFLNGNMEHATSSTAFVQTLPAGKYKFSIRFNNEPWTLRATYTTFANERRINDGDTLTFTAPVMVGWTYTSGTNYGTEVSPSVLTVHITSYSAKDNIARSGISLLSARQDDLQEDVDDLHGEINGAIRYDYLQEITESETKTARTNIAASGTKDLYEYGFYNALELGTGTSGTFNGITYTRISDDSWLVSGTATANSFRNVISSRLAIPEYIKLNRKYRLKFNGGSIPVSVFLYVGDEYSSKTYTSDSDIEFPEGTTGVIIRLSVESGITVDDTIRYELVPAGLSTNITTNNSYTYQNTITKTTETTQNTYNITTSPIITTDENGWLAAVDTDTEDETGKTDMTGAIMAMLESTGYCHLGEGIFYVSGNIDMPYHSTIEGCGDKTIIRLFQTVDSGYVIKPTQYCTIRNLGISGGYTYPSFGDVIGTRHGINWFANADGEEAAQPDVLHSVVDGVFIRNFSGSGIRLHNTGGNYAHSLYVANSMISRCYVGINIDYYSEFNKFCNVGMYTCKIACQNNGGNNDFVNCTFHATTIGFIIDNSDDLARNNAHGIVTNGTFCHIGSNTGKAIVVKNVSGGYIFNACQIHYNSIEVEDSNGIVFSNFQFGRGTTGQGAVINVSGGNLIMFNGCVFANDVDKPPIITISNNTKTKFVNCFGAVSGEPIVG